MKFDHAVGGFSLNRGTSTKDFTYRLVQGSVAEDESNLSYLASRHSQSPLQIRPPGEGWTLLDEQTPESLGRALASAIEWRYRRRHGEALAALEQADDRVFQFFRAGGTLAAWEAQSAEQWAARADDAPPTP